MMYQYGLIGYPLGHTMSPFTHERLFALSRREASYGTFEISPGDLPGQIDRLKQLDGFNITIPHKLALISQMDHLDASAQLLGAINVVKKDAGGWTGYNTDVDGFVRALASGGLKLAGHVCVLGCGGVARMIAIRAAQQGCRVTLAVRDADLPAARELAAHIIQLFPDRTVKVCTLSETDTGYDLLVNGTPVGMHPHADACPVSDAQIARCSGVFDCVYNPLETQLVQRARAQGIPALGGLSMLIYQAVVAHEIWYGALFNDADIAALIEDAGAYIQAHF